MNHRHFAHTREGAGQDEWQPLRVHLENTAALTADHARAFGSEQWGKIAGDWHDIGKYAEDFQDYLVQSSTNPAIVDASISDALADRKSGRIDHSSAGAVLVYERCQEIMTYPANALAMVIAGHHSGLADLKTFKDQRLINPDKQARLREVKRNGAPQELLDRDLPEPPLFLQASQFSGKDATNRMKLRCEFWTRMLLSALVDADRLDTERFTNERQARLRERTKGSLKTLARLKTQLDEYLSGLAEKARRDAAELPEAVRQRAEVVLDLRARVLEACRAEADQSPGRFSLTVPTGGGKTLAALAFALGHALRNDLRRIIVVIPFTSIIDQTARVYSEALRRLGRVAVVEHHSNLDPVTESYRNRLATENWDAPLIVTTSVQFFESLFSSRPSTLRKLHNIARSVVIFDEVQTLPHHLRAPIFDALNQLVDCYNVSALFCTATQPALDLEKIGRDSLPHLKDVVPLVNDVPTLFGAVADRVTATFPADEKPVTWEQLAALAANDDRALVIVHRRDDARDLCRLLPDGTFHLSALMCAAHRRDVLRQIKEANRPGHVCRVVSTTLVEAGVDLDFPVVYRAMGGADAMAQAAGRCNREGRLCDREGRPLPGRLVLFNAPSDPPEGLKRGLETARKLLRLHGDLNLFRPETFDRYFAAYLADVETDRPGIMRERLDRNFPEVDRLFRMIDDGGQMAIVVPYGDAAQRVKKYRDFPRRRTLRALQPFIVNVSKKDFSLLERGHLIEPIHDQVRWLLPESDQQYDLRFGLCVDQIVPKKPGDLIVDGL